ncbi:Core-2/I-branching beta-1 6-N-acetylglucosaminyltransferase family protein [Euphorbia peplus]|nr:Core-2/I-branching beta-1 6-N-acetylglucosaminyltransferase family protein [Euphorbia peplus]
MSSPPLPPPSPLPPPPPPPLPLPPPPPPPPSPPPPVPSPPPPPPPSPPLHAPSPSPSPSPSPLAAPPLEIVSSNNAIVSLMHNMSDEELLIRAIKVSNNSWEDVEEKKVKKVAFMFLAYGSLPFAPLWEKYFKGQEGLYSIYVHPHPSHNDSWPPSSMFFGRRIPSKAVYWGTKSMMDAERRLLANALLDTSNQRFILLSESCIPVMNFKTTYDYLMNTNLSFVEIYDNPGKGGRGRYNTQMSPYINITDWMKGSQWFEATRDLAIKIVSDQKYYKLFEDYCRPPCYIDEHYIPTLLNILYPKLSSNTTITYVDWSTRGAHPVKFGWNRITDEFLNGIRFGKDCVYNGNTTTMCFMFARKFPPNALDTLLRIAPPLLGFDP